MRYGLALFLLVAIPCWSQTTVTGKAETKGSCSLANTGNNNTFTIKCGISEKQGQKMLDILNKILANRLDPEAVMAKLDEILSAVNPNLPAKVYMCDGHWRSAGPGISPDGGISGTQMVLGGDDTAFKKMAILNNSKQYSELLKECQANITSTPAWLTPRLFCGLAYLAARDTGKAREMLKDYDSKSGPYYSAQPCQQMSDHLRQSLQ